MPGHQENRVATLVAIWLAVFGLTTAIAAARGMSATERKAVRREMIEMDVAARNLASIIATRDRKMLDDTLQRLSAWQIKGHPEFDSTFRGMLEKWRLNGSLKFGDKLHEEAVSMRKYTEAHRKFGDADWQRILTGFNRILSSCQGCHDLNKKETK
jgi:hypothetical protein